MTVDLPTENDQEFNEALKPAPIPVQFAVAPIRMTLGDESADAVMLLFLTNQGSNHFFLSLEKAEILVEHLQNAVRTAKTGLIVAGAGAVPTK